MKRFVHLVLDVIVLAMLVSACGGQSIPTNPATQESIVDTPSQVSIVDTPSLVPVDLAGPNMDVGSLYTYVDGSILAAVPGGPFLMGNNKYAQSKEHQVTLSDYWIYTSEVTNEQYALCLSTGKCTSPNAKDNLTFDDPGFVGYPVIGVDYQQAAEYCSFVHGRLPTEAEWEKAARGPDGNLFPWGDKSPVCGLLNIQSCKGATINVRSYPDGISYYGLFDMAGNVREWVADWYMADYATDAASSNNPQGPVSGEKRSVRSSSFADIADFANVAHRFSFKPVEHFPDLGFRCVVDDPTYYAPFCQGLILFGADVHGNPTNDVIPLPSGCVQPVLTYSEDCKTQTAKVVVSPWPLPKGSIGYPMTDLTKSQTFNNGCSWTPPTYTCSGSSGGSIKIFDNLGACKWPTPPSGGTCVSPYVQSPDKLSCIGQGKGVQCMPGFNYDPLSQCCSAQNPGPNQYGLCGPGFYHVGNACIPAANNKPSLHPVSKGWGAVAACPVHNGGGDNTILCTIDPFTGAQVCR
jgi:formylglycine-generating enzyme required for sulfatase activity